MNKPRIIFMGTPEFAAHTLKELLTAKANVVAVVTMPDKPKGRHQNLPQASPVKLIAKEHGLPVLQPQKLREPQFLQQLKDLRADMQIVVAFRMLPREVWSMPPMGTFNLHASLLPHYRGAAPINWAIINGETTTGVTTFLIDEHIDTGRILLSAQAPILDSDNFLTLHDRLMKLGADLVLQTVDLLAKGNYHGTPQSEIASEVLKHAPKIFRQTCLLQPEALTANQARNLIRGLSPAPGAWLEAGGKTLKVFRAELSKLNLKPGQWKCTGNELLLGCKQGTISVEELQLEGKRRMNIDDFLRGNTATMF